MVIYELKCQAGHVFEGWFKDAASFEGQKAQGFVQCAVCGTDQVIRVPSGCHVGKAKAKPVPQTMHNTKADQGSKPAIDYITMFKSVQKLVKDNFENVGDRFCDMALKMHKGEADHQNIYGTADAVEREKLDDEGVNYLPVPTLPESIDN